jgi:hypothetical protein
MGAPDRHFEGTGRGKTLSVMGYLLVRIPAGYERLDSASVGDILSGLPQGSGGRERVAVVSQEAQQLQPPTEADREIAI